MTRRTLSNQVLPISWCRATSLVIAEVWEATFASLANGTAQATPQPNAENLRYLPVFRVSGALG